MSVPIDTQPGSEAARSAALIAVQSGALVLLVGLIAWRANAACLAPPLGVTAFLLAKDPHGSSSSPRSIVVGHAVGLAAGFASASAFGVLGEPGALAGTFSVGHALASALAIALTVGITEGFQCSHPPAGATTLVASLGLLPFRGGTAAFMVGSLVLAACAWTLRKRRIV